MKGSAKLFICTNVFLLFSYNMVFGQIKIVKVSKQVCNTGYSKLEVEVRKDGVLLDSLNRKYYNYTSIYKLHDSVKLKIVEHLLQFVSDTSICCNSVQSYDNVEYPGCYDESPTSKSFSIRIESLFIINRVLYNTFTYRIGCYPVLYDSETKQEVNNNNCFVNIMVERYKALYKLYKDTGKLPDYHFLNESRIKWWGKHTNGESNLRSIKFR
jgi:hypothetical protein